MRIYIAVIEGEDGMPILQEAATERALIEFEAGQRVFSVTVADTAIGILFDEPDFKVEVT